MGLKIEPLRGTSIPLPSAPPRASLLPLPRAPHRGVPVASPSRRSPRSPVPGAEAGVPSRPPTPPPGWPRPRGAASRASRPKDNDFADVPLLRHAGPRGASHGLLSLSRDGHAPREHRASLVTPPAQPHGAPGHAPPRPLPALGTAPAAQPPPKRFINKRPRSGGRCGCAAGANPGHRAATRLSRPPGPPPAPRRCRVEPLIWETEAQGGLCTLGVRCGSSRSVGAPAKLPGMSPRRGGTLPSGSSPARQLGAAAALGVGTSSQPGISPAALPAHQPGSRFALGHG